ncbi:unnamed protein product [Cyclocybe aegerita]|uniref:F-box domain-containing protein n=1 Tax=Cyclocybe aegerita TaxID=1973307 RepID=A0A8S0W2K7_CYCAE|nr:unnamed protein product [Cyclocybe aegerita]
MAPRTRSNRVEMLAKQELIAKGMPPNAHGLPGLPNEIYLEILSHIPAAPVPTLTMIDEAHRDRHQTLLALSQTCRSLRRVFLPRLWQRIEVLDDKHEGYGRAVMYSRVRGYERPNKPDRKFVEDLVSLLEVVTVREPNLAIYVNVVNVTVLDYSVDTVLPELARCMTLFPNLHTVQLNLKLKRQRHMFLQDVFEPYSYPNVHTACLSESAIPFLYVCPGLRKLHSYLNAAWGASTLGHVLQHKKLEVLGAVTCHQEAIAYIVKSLLDLREITLGRTELRLGYDKIMKLSELPHLRTIRLAMNAHAAYKYRWIYPDRAAAAGISHAGATDEEIQQWLGWAKKILDGVRSADSSEKQVILIRVDGSEETRSVIWSSSSS